MDPELKVLDVLASLPAPCQCNTGTKCPWRGGSGDMGLFVGPHPTVLHLADPVIGTQDARVCSRP